MNATDPAATNPRVAAEPARTSPRRAAGTGRPPAAPVAGGRPAKTPAGARRNAVACAPAGSSSPGKAGMAVPGGVPGPGCGGHAPLRPGQGVLSAGQMAIARAMSEGELEEKVLELCEGFGVLRFHNPDSRRVREKGLPDDILIGPRGVLWRELKNMKRKLTPAQEKVGADLLANGCDWACWRPVDLLSRRIELELRAISGLRVAGGAA